METVNQGRLMNLPLRVEALIAGPRLRVRDLLALKPGSILETALPADGSVDVLAGHTLLGTGEFTASRGKAAVRILRCRGEK